MTDRPSAAQWWLRQKATYENRYQAWCFIHSLDPEDLGSVLLFEDTYSEDDLPTPYDYDP